MAGTVIVLAPAVATANAPARDFLLEDNGEIAVRDGDFALASGRQATKQGIQCNLRMLLGENFINELAGLDWLGSILVKNPNQLLVRELIRERILDVPDVTDAQVGELVKLENRQYMCDAQAADVFSAEPLLVQVGT